MDLEFKYSTPKKLRREFAEQRPHQPLILLRNTEGLLRRRTVETLAPLLSKSQAKRIQAASVIAEDSLHQLAEIDLDEIGDFELRSPRILIGLSFVGFGALAIALLILYLYTLHPELNSVEQIGKYWYQYVWFVCLGVTGMFMLGREAMRPNLRQQVRGYRSSK